MHGFKFNRFEAMQTPMDEIIKQLSLSIEDEILSRTERRSLKELIGKYPLDEQQISFLRSKIYEIAKVKATAENYPFILEWIKNVNNTLNIRGTDRSDAFFSPGEACRKVIIQQINNAEIRLKICVFTISNDQIARALVESHKRGKKVCIITDNDKSFDQGSDIAWLAKEGIVVKMDNTPNHMHHKFMISDDKALITGSYNWTHSAARFNHENILRTTDGVAVKAFLQEFDRLWSAMDDY